MGWSDEKQEFLNEFNRLNTTSKIDTKVAELNDVIASYIQTGGLTDPANTQSLYAKIGPQVETITGIKTEYSDLNNKINKEIINHVGQVNVSDTLTDIATLQTRIKTYEHDLKDINVDVETALARDELLRSRNTKRDSHTLFLMDRYQFVIISQLLKIGYVFIFLFIMILFING
jgi:flagellar hook-associated protein FlgK